MRSVTHPYIEQLLDFYVWAAPLYDASAGGAHDRAADRLAELAAVEPHEHALDAGCGTGLVTHRLGGSPAHGGYALGVDISDAMLHVARADRPAGSGAVFAPMDAHDLVLRDATFDVVTMGQLLPYLVSPDVALAEAGRVLRAGGRIAVSCQRRSLCTAAEARFFAILEEMGGGFRIPRLPDYHDHFGEPWALQALLEQAGFERVSTTQMVIGNHTPDAKAWVDLMMQAGPYPHALLSLLQPAGRARFEQRVAAAMEELGETAYTYHRAFTFAVARRP
ncbi:MAG: methyltransferase domain-containing protein [Candidatus Dormibacteraeota bacterium]|nr:methyltransferase domain-containing protein [Candidatus Dormibacteraeota bacterium]MBV9525136.1 methyltransferase domain-containing protein [Candidatus Dormibacteraeota bacterium]